ncbi:hypothetical protein [Kitasatospora sp. NPDC093679]|uniref:hypothetical protein n=1 Tax=Kitasatospora sp. NPDC093679 TaxID=3154983 RepID=UPI003436C004
MAAEARVTPWAEEAFGALAPRLVDLVPECLARAHERARDAHEGAQTQTLEAYGHGLYAAQFEQLAMGLADLPGADAVRLQARTVMVVAGHVLYPIRYAKRDTPVSTAKLRRTSGLRADLIRRHGPDPRQGELDLGPAFEAPEDEVHGDLAKLSPDTKLVLVAYACAHHSGIVRLEWGSAELQQQNRSLVWHHHEPLPIPRGPEQLAG